MPISNGNRKILDLKRWEFCTPAPAATATGHFIVSSRHYRQQQLLIQSNTAAFLYNPAEDGWIQIPSPALAGTFGAGACGTAGAFSTGRLLLPPASPPLPEPPPASPRTRTCSVTCVATAS